MYVLAKRNLQDPQHVFPPLLLWQFMSMKFPQGFISFGIFDKTRLELKQMFYLMFNIK